MLRSSKRNCFTSFPPSLSFEFLSHISFDDLFKTQSTDLFNFRPAKLILTFERSWALHCSISIEDALRQQGLFSNLCKLWTTYLMFPLSTFAVVIINYERKCRTFERSWTRQRQQLRDAPETSSPARWQRLFSICFCCPILSFVFFVVFSHDDDSDDDV